MYPFAIGMLGFGVVSALVAAATGLAGVALYVLRSWGVYKMAANTGLSYPWFAWIPVLHEYLCAKMGDRTRLAQAKSPFLEKTFVVAVAAGVALHVAAALLGGVFLVGTLLGVARWLLRLLLYVLVVLCDYWTFQDFEPSMAALFTLLSFLRLDGIAKFMVRDNVPVGVAGLCTPKQPKYGK